MDLGVNEMEIKDVRLKELERVTSELQDIISEKQDRIREFEKELELLKKEEAVHLEPCPFCGSTNVVAEETELDDPPVYWVQCNSCLACGPFLHNHFDSEDDYRKHVVDAWNAASGPGSSEPITEEFLLSCGFEWSPTLFPKLVSGTSSGGLLWVDLKAGYGCCVLSQCGQLVTIPMPETQRELLTLCRALGIETS